MQSCAPLLTPSDLHLRARAAERQLPPDALHKLQKMERRDARKMSKLLKVEAKEQTRAVGQAMEHLARLTRAQKAAIDAERKSQARVSEHIRLENSALKRFLKEKERYDAAEAGLLKAKAEHEERQAHAERVTAQIAEQTQHVDNLRATKSADDVSAVRGAVRAEACPEGPRDAERAFHGAHGRLA